MDDAALGLDDLTQEAGMLLFDRRINKKSTDGHGDPAIVVEPCLKGAIDWASRETLETARQHVKQLALGGSVGVARFDLAHVLDDPRDRRHEHDQCGMVMVRTGDVRRKPRHKGLCIFVPSVGTMCDHGDKGRQAYGATVNEGQIPWMVGPRARCLAPPRRRVQSHGEIRLWSLYDVTPQRARGSGRKAKARVQEQEALPVIAPIENFMPQFGRQEVGRVHAGLGMGACCLGTVDVRSCHLGLFQNVAAPQKFGVHIARRYKPVASPRCRGRQIND